MKKHQCSPMWTANEKAFNVWTFDSPDKIDDTLLDRQSCHCHTQTDTWILVFLSSPALFDLKMGKKNRRCEKKEKPMNRRKKLRISSQKNINIESRVKGKMNSWNKKWHFFSYFSSVFSFNLHIIDDLSSNNSLNSYDFEKYIYLYNFTSTPTHDILSLLAMTNALLLHRLAIHEAQIWPFSFFFPIIFTKNI